MAQTILTVYAGDQIYKYVVSVPGGLLPYLLEPSYMIRLGGTFMGLIIALLMWYIGRYTTPILRIVLFIR
jgi:hypothetical protein